MGGKEGNSSEPPEPPLDPPLTELIQFYAAKMLKAEYKIECSKYGALKIGTLFHLSQMKFPTLIN